MISFLESLPPTIEECLQFSTGYIGTHKIRLVPGKPESERFINAIEAGKEIVIFKEDSFTIFHTFRVSLLSEDKAVSLVCSQQLENLLSNFTFNGELLGKDESSKELYEAVYQEVRLNGGLPPEHGKSMEEVYANYLKIMIMLELDPKELIEKKYLCRDTVSKYGNEEALTYIKALEIEKSRKISMSACQPALSLLEASSPLKLFVIISMVLALWKHTMPL